MSKLKPKTRKLLIVLGVILAIIAIYMIFIRVHVFHKPGGHGDIYALLVEENWDNTWGDTMSFSEDGGYSAWDGGGSPVGTSDLTPNFTFDEKHRSVRIFGDFFLFNEMYKITYIDPNFLVTTAPLPYTSSYWTYNGDFPDSVQYALDENWIYVQVHKLDNGKITIAPYDHVDGNAETAKYISQIRLAPFWKCYSATADDLGKEAEELPLLSGDDRKALIKEHGTAFVKFNFRGKITDVVFIELEIAKSDEQ
ncbi:MAG: hypothetical protein IJF14_06065 [Clostridia bacterium]|nr:hypothetical protein [Clostridia bacterium]